MILGAITFLKGSKTAQMVAVCGLAVVGVWVYGQYKESIGGNKREAKIIKNTKKAGRRKNAKSSKIRKRIVPSTAANSLWDKYGAN